MTDREKTISNFEHDVNKAHGEGFPFIVLRTKDTKEILALLKEQEERIKKFELERSWDENPDMMGKW